MQLALIRLQLLYLVWEDFFFYVMEGWAPKTLARCWQPGFFLPSHPVASSFLETNLLGGDEQSAPWTVQP